MSGLAKAFVVINLILALFFLGASATLFGVNKNWKEVAEEEGAQKVAFLTEWKGKVERYDGRIASLEENLRTKDAELATLSTQRQDLENANGDLKVQNTQFRSQVDTLNQQISQKDQHLQDRDNTLAAKDEEIERLTREKTEADAAKGAAVELAQRARLDLQQQEESVERLSIELNETRKQLNDKTTWIAIAERAGFNMASIGVQAVPKIDGVISAVRGDIVVLSVGRQDNVREGFEFTIYEGDRFIGKVKVESLLDDMSGARVLFTEQGATLKAGQSASTRLAG